MTQVLFINHASLLIEHEGQYLLTDPWNERPAFGSWLPSHPPAVHPVYLASLENLSILISHGHCDHCDDDVLRLFNCDTPVISRFPWVGTRARASGLRNFRLCKPELTIGCFKIKSYQTTPGDAIYTIETPDALIAHQNDNWHPGDDILQAIKYDIDRIGANRVLYCSQVGSASGWPLNYRCYTDEEKKDLLAEKINKMVASGVKACDALGLDKFVPYAGYALPFVNDYISKGINPTPSNLNNNRLWDFRPGDIFDFETPIIHSFTGNRGKVAEKAEEYYRLYDKVPKYEGEVMPHFEKRLDAFLKEFSQFCNSDKTLRIITGDIDRSIQLNGNTRSTEQPNKTLIVDPLLMDMVLCGELLFESLYTGYLGEWERHPKDVYNNDILGSVVSFSYYWMDKIQGKAA